MLEFINNIWVKIPNWLKNRYSVTLLVFIVWMTFFDLHRIPNRYRNWRDLKVMERQVRYYEKEIETVKADLHDLTTNEASLEKFAREKYWMKKPNEDLFIIVED